MSMPARVVLAMCRWARRAAALICLAIVAGVLAVVPANAERLRVLRTGLGQGTVTGAGIGCGTVCTRDFVGSGQVAVLTAVPSAGSVFGGWGGDCAGMGPTCTVTVGTVTSVRAAFAPATPIPALADVTPAGISAYLAANPAVDTPAEFISALPPDYRENWMLMVRSESLQTGTATSPRILLPSANYRRVFTVGMTLHGSYPGSHPNAIEFMEWDGTEMNFRFHEIVLAPIPALGGVVKRATGQPDVYRFPPRPRGVSLDDSKCFARHSTRNVLNDAPGATPGTDGIPPRSVEHKSKPNWDTYDSWGGMLAFNRDRLYQGSVEVAAFRKIFNPWTWQGADTVRSIIERLELQPSGVPPSHVISRNSGGGANDGHISFPFDGGAIVTREPLPTGTPGGSTNYRFDGAAGLGTATNFVTDGNFVTMHSTGFPGCFGGACGPTGAGGALCVEAVEVQPGAPLLQRQEDVALAAEVDEVALPVAELAAKMGLCRALVDRRAVGDGGLAPAVAPSPAALRLALGEQPRQPRSPAGRAVGVAVDGLRTDPVLRSVELHPPRDLLRGPSHGKAVLDLHAKAGGARDPRAAQLALPGPPRGAVRPVAVGAPVAGELALDRAPVAAEPPGDLADAQAHLHQAAQAASLLKAEVAVSLSHGGPGHSRCRTWFVSLRRPKDCRTPAKPLSHVAFLRASVLSLRRFFGSASRLLKKSLVRL